MEGDFALVECFQGGKGECLITPACRLKGALHKAMAAFLAALDQYTLQNLVTRNPDLKILLGSQAA